MQQQETPPLVVHTETIALYSEKCVAYLAHAVKNAESSVEDDFRRFYQASEAEEEADVRHSSSDEDGGNKGRASEDDESESEEESQITDTTSVSSSNPTLAKTDQSQPSRQAKNQTLNEKEKENAVRRMDKPPYSLLPLGQPDHYAIEIPNALLSKEQRLSSMIVQCEAYHRLSCDLALIGKPTVVLLLSSGRLAVGIFVGPKCLLHTTSSRYTIRKGQGKAQSAQDGKRKPKSVGSQLRRAGEEALRQDVKSFLQRNKALVQSAGLILLSCPKAMMKNLYDDNDDIIRRGDGRVRKIPLDVGRPTFEAAVAVYEIMMRVHIVQKPPVFDEMPTLATEISAQPLQPLHETREGSDNEDEKIIIAMTRLHELAATANLPELIQLLGTEAACTVDQAAGEDFMTALHYASASSENVDPMTSAACVTALLVQGRANPCVLDARGRVPYFLASHEKVRDAFRMARATLGEDYCNWDSAKVGPPLTADDLQAKKEKAAEKKRRQRARQKEKSQREAVQIEEAERQRKEEEERQKQEDDAKRIRDRLQPKTSSATNVCDFCQKVCKNKRRSQMLQRLSYAYCSSECVQNHKRELMAAAALARFG
ncbi:hypothetical protein MHU86_20205 [Fragilaria crotonensis]|nr:hypothetical protein MHU86_20205 [Fragilaria crotonensis]